MAQDRAGKMLDVVGDDEIASGQRSDRFGAREQADRRAGTCAKHEASVFTGLSHQPGDVFDHGMPTITDENDFPHFDDALPSTTGFTPASSSLIELKPELYRESTPISVSSAG